MRTRRVRFGSKMFELSSRCNYAIYCCWHIELGPSLPSGLQDILDNSPVMVFYPRSHAIFDSLMNKYTSGNFQQAQNGSIRVVTQIPDLRVSYQ